MSTVTRPLNPKVARNANASMTPPNWASTPEAAITSWRRRPFGSPRTTAQASRPPKMAPRIAVITASWIDFTIASMNTSVVNIALKLSSVNWPVGGRERPDR